MKKTSNVIVGGGIVGLLSAWHLIERGEKVIVVEKQHIARESSWAGAGVLSPLYPNRYPSIAPLVSRSLGEYPRIAKELAGLTSLDPELVFCELILLDELTSARGKEQGSGKIVTDSVLKRMEPSLNAPLGRAVCYPSAHVRNPRFLSALRSALPKKGATLLECCEVQSFRNNAGRLTGLLTSRGVFDTNCCVVTAGAWTGELLKTVGLSVPIKPIKGQIVVFAARPGLLSHIIVKNYLYLVPRMDGRILVGSTVEDTGFSKETTKDARETLYAGAIELVPALRKYPIEHHWAGLRPGSPDDAPFIGEHPGIKGLFVCAGHYRNGFATGPASARLVVDMMLGRQPMVDPTPFRLDRPCPEWRM